jgi:ribonuclease HII
MLETELWARGYRMVAGIDEVGRGAWAGPVVAAAVVLPPDGASLAPILGLVDDSKKLTDATRRRLSGLVRSCALAVGLGSVAAPVIDQLGIVPTTRRAMTEAVMALAPPPDFLLLDFLTLPDLPCPQQGIAHGDGISLFIAAASIIAKVARDDWMAAQEEVYPGYGFAQNKGYGTALHARALRRYGPCSLHRRSFRPVARASSCDHVEDQHAGSHN